MERKTFSIMFFIKRTKLRKNQEAPIILRITVNKERADISIQRSINPEQWNSAKGGAKTVTQYGKDLNEYLDQIRLKLYQCHQDLKFRNKVITAVALKDAYLNGVDQEVRTLLALYREHNADLKVKIDQGVSKNTYKRHETFLRVHRKCNNNSTY